MAWLSRDDAALAGNPLFAVLGVGDRNWADTYQAVPERIDERLTELGATPLVPRAAADTSGDLNGTVEEFSGRALGGPGAALRRSRRRARHRHDEPLYDLHPIVGPVTAAIDARFTVTPMTVLENDELVERQRVRSGQTLMSESPFPTVPSIRRVIT